MKVINSLEQVRGHAETVYEPFLLQKDELVIVILWRCPGMKIEATAHEYGIDFSVSMEPPSNLVLKGLKLDLPGVSFKPLKSSFGFQFEFRVLPNTLRAYPETHKDLIIMQVQKVDESVSKLTF